MQTNKKHVNLWATCLHSRSGCFSVQCACKGTSVFATVVLSWLHYCQSLGALVCKCDTLQPDVAGTAIVTILFSSLHQGDVTLHGAWPCVTNSIFRLISSIHRVIDGISKKYVILLELIQYLPLVNGPMSGLVDQLATRRPQVALPGHLPIG